MRLLGRGFTCAGGSDAAGCRAAAAAAALSPTGAGVHGGAGGGACTHTILMSTCVHRMLQRNTDARPRLSRHGENQRMRVDP